MKKIALIAALLFTIRAAAQQDINVQYYNADSSIRYGGTLTIPATTKPFPAVILISGTGKQDRDGTMAGHKMFKIIADSLVKNGIGVLRLDDRGTGETTGNYDSATTADFANDAIRAIQWLKSYPGVHKIGLIGHSEGGAVAYMAAAQSKDVAFIISLAGLATPGLAALIQQNKAIVESAPISPLMKERFNNVNKVMFDTAYTYAQSPDLESHLRHAFATWNAADDARGEQDTAWKKSKEHFFFPLESYIYQATGPWYRFHIRFDPASYLKAVKVPILAINGDKDIMVNAQENLASFKKYNKHVTTLIVPGLNHLFQHCITCTMQEPATLKEDFDEDVLIKMTMWIKSGKVSASM